MDPQEIKDRLKKLGVTQAALADELGITQDKVSKSLSPSGKRRFTAEEVSLLDKYLREQEPEPDLPEHNAQRDYLPISILPSYAGMGGGGSGEGDQEVAMLPRALIEDELRGKPTDFELIDVRGDSMMPDFQHGDQILIDRRDRDPIQPGPFALYDGDGYVVKLVERVPQKRGWYRVFSANERYSEYEVEETETTILGRPVWFARRL